MRLDRRLLLALVLLLSLWSGQPAMVSAAPLAAVAVRGDALVDATGKPLFVLGVNYEGPVDRAWHLWDDGQWDPSLVAKDLDHAKAANLNTVRIFLQPGLLTDIRAGKWTKLDTFLDLADQRGLRVILTQADYASGNVADLASVAGQVAAHLKGRTTVLALDLKNEPHFGDIALATYPAGLDAALQNPATVQAVGETIARADIPTYRASDQGQQRVPARLTDDQAYVYVNVLDAYLQFLQAAQDWASAHQATVVDYSRSPDAAQWQPLLDAMNRTLGAWMKPQLDAIRAADPNRLVTLAQVDPVLASLPLNGWLDYRTLHKYPSVSTAGVQFALGLLGAEKAALPDKPLLLGEFGFPNNTVSETDSASLEAAMAQGVRDQGGAGALVWMLNDVPNGGNDVQDSYGLYRGDGSAKPVVAAFQALGTLTPNITVQAPPQATPTSTTQVASPPAPTSSAQTPPLAHDGRYFSQTGYRIDNDAIWSYFQARGGVTVFGYPVSRTISLLGCQAQLFQRQVAQVCADGTPRLMNILDPDVFPYTRVNGSTFPAPDTALKQATPRADDPAYATKIVDFVRANVPDTLGNQPVSFGQTFFGTISAAMANTDSPGILSLLDLEVWGAPISKPAADPANGGFIYQRFQRGIMHYNAATHQTQGILLADYLKQIMVGPSNNPNLPADLAQQAKGTRFFAQYCPANPSWLCRPSDLPGTDLTFGFEPG